MKNYVPKTIEEKWQKIWEDEGLFNAEDFSKKQKKYILIEFPYPSGAGLHVGHVRSYTALDVLCRKMRMDGYNVMYPIGWDAFGLPTENYAIKNKIHPRIATEQNICTFTKQIKSLGISFDWSREIDTTDPAYYKWTQWIFLKLYENGLAYKANIPINWCPACKIGLANEEVVDGKCERCGAATEKRQKEQWMLAITKYADRLINDLETVDYLEKIKSQQINWIGRSEGAEIEFRVILRSDGGETKNPELNTGSRSAIAQGKLFGRSASLPQDDAAILKVFTTRPDTLFGCTYLVVSLEHEIIKNYELRIMNYEEVDEYINNARKKSDLERTENKEKTGVELKGILAINPVNGEEIPIFAADYILAGYGTGAIMAVPAHDERDFEFAKKYGLAIKEVVTTENENIIGVGAFIENKDGMFLFQKRDNKAENNPDKIAFFGGGLEKDENYIEGLNRELKEELDLEIGDEYLEVIGDFKSDLYKDKFIKLFYIKNTDDSKIKLKEGEKIVLSNLKDDLENNNFTDFARNAMRVFLNTKTSSNEEAFDDREDFCPRCEIKDCHLEHSIRNNKKNVKQLKNGEEPAEGLEPSNHQVTIRDQHHTAGTDTPKSLYQKNNRCGIYNGCFTDEGIAINSGFLNGLKTKDAKEKMIEWLEKNETGKKEVQYKLRDWVFSRQRYWGEPMPVVYCEHCAKRIKNQELGIKNQEFSKGELLNPGWIALGETQLPLTLPDVKSYEPTDTGESPLANVKDWITTACPKCGSPARRETDTMPNWAGSSWYFLRYIDPKNDNAFADPKKLKYWMQVDLYNGGMEHTTLHLLYSRFWNKFLYDIGVVPFCEPYARRVSHGMILAEDGKKMSKSLGNVINPDDVVNEFGADALRVYEMFIGPYAESIPWSIDGLKGVRKFLEKVWKVKSKVKSQKHALSLPNGSKDADGKIKSLLHKTIKKVTEDIENFKFNTAISAMMILVNEMEREEMINVEDYRLLILILSPFAPHICEELWSFLHTSDVETGASPRNERDKPEGNSIFMQKWPAYNPDLAKDETVDMVIQINGKVRDKFEAPADILGEDAKNLALEREKIKEWTKGKNISKVFFVKGKLVNIVLK